MRDFALSYPVVLKPDVGQRGSGVVVVHGEGELEGALRGRAVDLLIQEFVQGPELGVFHVRPPSSAHGFIFSITEKILPGVTGDGVRTLEQLVLDDERSLGMLRLHLTGLRNPHRVPAPGEAVPLTEVGNHSRGALFRDGAHLETPALLEAVERMSRGYRGFHFGRYDLRAPSLQAFREGRDIRILELNGVTSEATDIYDPANGPLAAYRKLFRQWRLVFAIGAENRRLGAAPASLSDLLRLLVSGSAAPAPRSGASTLPV